MSEYQYYEFRAVDRPLDDKERSKLRALSTRAEITSTSFTNTYQWGDFKGDPDELMDHCFDAFVYVANWGTNQLMFRIPKRFIDTKAVSAYCVPGMLSLDVKKEHVVLEFLSEDQEVEDWVEGEPWMPSLISIRNDIMRGDYRALYLGWLASLRRIDPDDEDSNRLEPPVPPGLAKLSGSLNSLADFLQIENELIEVAAERNERDAPAEPSGTELLHWIKKLPVAEKNAYLLHIFDENGVHLLRAELSKRFREATLPKAAPGASNVKPRTITELLEATNVRIAEKHQKAAERAALAKAKVEQEKAEARVQYLNKLSTNAGATWNKVEALIATKTPKNYDVAIDLLVDLRDMAAGFGRTALTEKRIQEIRSRQKNKPALLKRFDAKKLGI